MGYQWISIAMGYFKTYKWNCRHLGTVMVASRSCKVNPKSVAHDAIMVKVGHLTRSVTKSTMMPQPFRGFIGEIPVLWLLGAATYAILIASHTKYHSPTEDSS